MISEYANALPLLTTALGELKKGQVLRREGYDMGELMAAIEVRPLTSV
jgi:hypothetical protein